MSSIYIGQYDDAGSKNCFYIVPGRRFGKRRIGFKEFEDKDQAEFAYRIQTILAEKTLAPRVYGELGRIRRMSDGTLTEYGYLTEIAKPMPWCEDEDCGGDCYDTDCKNSNDIMNVVSMLSFYGLEYSDHHRANFGYIRRNSKNILVVIDVGIESFDSWDTSIYGEFGGGECSCTYCRNN
jgi:hypothetical protein